MLLRAICAFVLLGILVAGLWPFHAPKNEVSWLNHGSGLFFGKYGSIVSAGPIKADPIRADSACSRGLQHTLHILRLPTVKRKKMHALGRSKLERGARLAQLFACRALHQSRLTRRGEIDYPVLKMLPNGEVLGQRSNLFGGEIDEQARRVSNERPPSCCPCYPSPRGTPEIIHGPACASSTNARFGGVRNHAYLIAAK
jgi:hypothetical protein